MKIYNFFFILKDKPFLFLTSLLPLLNLITVNKNDYLFIENDPANESNLIYNFKLNILKIKNILIL